MIEPGFTDTPMPRTVPTDQYAAAAVLEPSGAAASLADIARAIVFFCDPGTRFIMGQTYFADGGKSLGSGLRQSVAALGSAYLGISPKHARR
ncbi:hypothetical protein PCE31106_03776 [Pandoraea cepalis]|uniref:Uncharacterized protein n=1 Tax=Pandoraea cepalis TaxID=2508294 RepID=A0A5E4XC56_9BURK|nr:SDR family oxidoreductase [Pandoraea cepalis]VVE33718.1 hypothetical protein PCE31106_03776 [Pandoraea cepalis]